VFVGWGCDGPAPASHSSRVSLAAASGAPATIDCIVDNTDDAPAVYDAVKEAISTLSPIIRNRLHGLPAYVLDYADLIAPNLVEKPFLKPVVITGPSTGERPGPRGRRLLRAGPGGGAANGAMAAVEDAVVQLPSGLGGQSLCCAAGRADTAGQVHRRTCACARDACLTSCDRLCAPRLSPARAGERRALMEQLVREFPDVFAYPRATTDRPAHADALFRVDAPEVAPEQVRSMER
jgi:hypothetical protein